MLRRAPCPLPLLLGLCSCLALVACVNAPPETRGANGDEIRFESRSGIAKANGIFRDWRVVDARIDPGRPAESHVAIEIDVDSIDTGFERRDAHLRDPDFFDAATWPHARVRVSDARPVASEGAGGAAPDSYQARFEVEIRDRREALEGAFRVVSRRPLVVEGELEIDRTSFGVGSPNRWWNPMAPRNQVPVHFRLTLEPDGP